MIDVGGDDNFVVDSQILSIMKVVAKPGVDEIHSADDLLLASLNEVRVPDGAGAEVIGAAQGG